MRLKLSWLLFTCLLVGFVLALPLRTIFYPGIDVSWLLVPVGVLGGLLVVVSAGATTGRWLKLFFILAGAAVLGEPLSLWLHNILVKTYPTEPVTYVLVFYILPVAFVVGVVGAIISGIVRLIARR